MSKKQAQQPAQYFERQEKQLCGKHAINNLIGHELLCYDWNNRDQPVCRRNGNTTLVNLAFYANSMTQNLKHVVESGGGKFIKELDYGDDTGNVTIEAMTEAVKELTHNNLAFRLEVVRIDPNTAANYGKDVHFKLEDLQLERPNERVVGFIHGNRSHYTAVKVRHEPGSDATYQPINSMSTRPGYQKPHLAQMYFKKTDAKTYVMTSRPLKSVLLKCPHAMLPNVYYDFQSKQFVTLQQNQQLEVFKQPARGQRQVTLEIGSYMDASEDAMVTAYWAPTSSKQYYFHYGIKEPQPLTVTLKLDQFEKTYTFERNKELVSSGSKFGDLKWDRDTGIVRYLHLDPRRRASSGHGGGGGSGSGGGGRGGSGGSGRGGSGGSGGSGSGGGGGGKSSQTITRSLNNDNVIDLTGGKLKKTGKSTKKSSRASPRASPRAKKRTRNTLTETRNTTKQRSSLKVGRRWRPKSPSARRK